MPRALTKKKSNLRDVAAFAGVSVATVSRVLNAPEKVSYETRERVEAAIAQLKFVPSAAARAINSGRSRIVAALLPTLDNAIYARVVNGLENRLAADGLSLIVAQTGHDLGEELRRARQMLDIGAEALIVTGISHESGLYDLMERTQIPVVAVSYFEDRHRLPTVGYDNAEAAGVAARHMAALGHKRVAALHGPAASNDRTRARIDALKTANHGIDFQFFEVPLRVEGGRFGVTELLESDLDCTGIVCLSDVIAHGALFELQRRGFSVPHEMSIMGIENLPGSQFTFPSLTSVDLSVEEMGSRAANAISQWLENDARPQPVRLSAKLVWRASTAPPMQASLRNHTPKA